MLNLNSFLVSSDNAQDLAEFYKKVLQKDPDWSEGGYVGFQVGSGYLVIGPHDKIHGKNQTPERLIMNFETEDVQGEFERIRDLGATVVAEPYHPDAASEMSIGTLQDPDGNYFQVASPMK